jgi:hypothetical protein
MLKLKLLIGLLSIFFSVSMSYSQITKVETPGPSGVKFRSVIDSQEYVLYINYLKVMKNQTKSILFYMQLTGNGLSLL